MSNLTQAGYLRRKKYATAAIVLIVGCLCLLPVWILTPGQHDLVRFSSGPDSGVYSVLAQNLSSTFTQRTDTQMDVLRSNGSNENADRLASGACDIALLQNDTESQPSIRTIAVLYEEPLHLLVRRDRQIRCLSHLAGCRISAGSRRGGTARVTEALMKFVLSPQEQPELVPDLSPLDAIKALSDGSIDAAFMVTGLRTPALVRALADDQLLLLPLLIHEDDSEQQTHDLIDGFRTLYPYVHHSSIPMRTYGGTPEAVLPTLGISSVLACRADASDTLVNELTETLFRSKAQLARTTPALADFNEETAVRNLHFPLHPGADNYYRRREPTFLEKHAESMGFLLTVALLLGSAIQGLASWKKRLTKDYIDVYFQRLSALGREVELSRTQRQLERLSKQVVALENEASDDLVAEQLRPDTAYVILLQMSTSLNNQIQVKITQLDEQARSNNA